MELKRIQTPYTDSLFRNFRVQLVGQAAEFKFDPKFKSFACHLAITPKGYSRKTIKGIDCKVNDWALGAALWHILGGFDW